MNRIDTGRRRMLRLGQLGALGSVLGAAGLARAADAPALLTPAIVADQRRVADAFARLGLIPKPVHVADIVWHPTKATL